MAFQQVPYSYATTFRLGYINFPNEKSFMKKLGVPLKLSKIVIPDFQFYCASQGDHTLYTVPYQGMI